MSKTFIVYPRQSLFDLKYQSFIKLSTIKLHGNTGPSGGSGIDRNRQLAQIKEIAESLDRRSSMLWYDNDEMVECLDIVTSEIVRVPKKKFSLSNKILWTDTTGSAAHTISADAVKFAILELFQKNALIDIWYKKKASKLIIGNTKFLISTHFFPSIHVLAMKELNNNVFFSMGSGFDLLTAIKSAQDELSLLANQNARLSNQNLLEDTPLDYSMDTDGQKNYFLKIFKVVHVHTKDDLRLSNLNNDPIKELLQNHTRHLYVRLLPNDSLKKIRVVRAVSDELINSLPYKDILLNYPRYQRMMLTKEEIMVAPTIPSV